MPQPSAVDKGERLIWDSDGVSVWLAKVAIPKRKYTQLYLFAFVRRFSDGNGILQGTGYVVSRNGFNDLREFDTLDEAKLYVESIYELERS